MSVSFHLRLGMRNLSSGLIYSKSDTGMINFERLFYVGFLKNFICEIGGLLYLESLDSFNIFYVLYDLLL